MRRRPVYLKTDGSSRRREASQNCSRVNVTVPLFASRMPGARARNVYVTSTWTLVHPIVGTWIVSVVALEPAFYVDIHRRHGSYQRGHHLQIDRASYRLQQWERRRAAAGPSPAKQHDVLNVASAASTSFVPRAGPMSSSLMDTEANVAGSSWPEPTS